MAKKNSGKVVQMLSPENYIRTKARTLPIYECRVNPDWAEAKQVTCIVSRKHNNGNVTYCFYLVDLLCLGLRHTHFIFNEPLFQYNDFLEQEEEDVPLELVDYALVHNIIHAGIEYAEEFEFKPCKDYTAVTQYFLEEDNDDIELMDIECGGDDGQPVYLYNSATTSAKEINGNIAKLEKTAGPDNYALIDEEDIEEDDLDDDFDDQEDIYIENTFEENKEVFINLFYGLKDSDDPKDLSRLTKVTDALFFEITDEELVNQYYDEFFDHLSIDVELKEISKEFLGVKPEVEIDEELKVLFVTVLGNIHRNLKKAHKDFELFRREAKGMSAVALLELLILQKESSNKYVETLQKYTVAYPDYSPITLLWLAYIYESESVTDEIANKNFSLDTFFPGRDSLHLLELFYYLIFISKLVAYEKNAEKMEAFYQVLDEFDLPELISGILVDLFSLSRIEYFAKHFNIEID